MNARLLAAFLCLTTLGTGCIIVDGGGDSGPGNDVTFLWTFGADGRCVDVPNVKSIRLTIPGETLDSNGNYACNTAGVDGITLRNFRSGTYNYTINAIDAYNQVVYASSGSFTVSGASKQVRVDLTPDGMTYAYVSWYFPAKGSFSRPTCAQANVTSMKAQIDNGELVSVDCTEGQTGMGIATPYLTPGQHTLRLVAYGYDSAGRNNMPLYNLYGTFTTQRGEPVSAQFGFFAVGGISLSWDFKDTVQNRTYSCAESGVTKVIIHLLDLSTNTYVFGNTGESFDCGEAPAVNQFMKPGDYKVYAYGMNGNTKIFSNEGAPPTVTVRAFVQKTEGDASTPLVLSRP